MLTVTTSTHAVDPAEMTDIITGLDWRAGVVLSSGVEFPGRYTQWDLGFIDPPLKLEGRGFSLRMQALNDRGLVPLRAFVDALQQIEGITLSAVSSHEYLIEITPQRDELLAEEDRTRRRSSFTVLRALIAALPSDAPHLGLYGPFGYDLVRQIEALNEPAGGDQRDLVVYLPDSVLAVDRQRGDARRYDYEFEYLGQSTQGTPRTEVPAPFSGPDPQAQPSRDHQPGEYAQLVREAKDSFRRGDLFEVVPGQAFRRPLHTTPSRVFQRLRRDNPAPYGALMNLGGNEFLITASPEMFVRVNGRRIETAPISGTIARGADAIEDEGQIRTLLNSEKDRAELTMCTDVDRNDKARICEPGSVRIIGRRQVELYAKVIHTVDHVEGTLRPGYDGIDAVATHMWAVTVTGAPKIWAMRFIDEHERSPRTWYAGALGVLGANGDVNTGLTIRAAMIRDGIAEVRAGGTLLIESVPEEEERETEMKASALLEAIDAADTDEPEAEAAPLAGSGHRILFFDHEDSFVQMLAGYMRETGAEVHTVRVPKGGLETEAIAAVIDQQQPTLVVMSPGPGNPADFADARILAEVDRRGLPVFGVCLGQQAMAEYFGATLKQLEHPLHGQEREVRVVAAGFLDSLPETFVTGRYHSLYVDPDAMPENLTVVANDTDGIPMAIQHRDKPWFAVQFHPESLMTLRDRAGHRIIDAVLAQCDAPQ